MLKGGQVRKVTVDQVRRIGKDLLRAIRAFERSEKWVLNLEVVVRVDVRAHGFRELIEGKDLFQLLVANLQAIG